MTISLHQLTKKKQTNGFNMTSTHKNREHPYHKTIHTVVVKQSLNQHLQHKHHSADYSFNNFQHIRHSLFKITICSTVITTSSEGFRLEVCMLEITLANEKCVFWAKPNVVHTVLTSEWSCMLFGHFLFQFWQAVGCCTMFLNKI